MDRVPSYYYFTLLQAELSLEEIKNFLIIKIWSSVAREDGDSPGLF